VRSLTIKQVVQYLDNYFRLSLRFGRVEVSSLKKIVGRVSKYEERFVNTKRQSNLLSLEELILQLEDLRTMARSEQTVFVMVVQTFEFEFKLRK